jgi:hypothetical protein
LTTDGLIPSVSIASTMIASTPAAIRLSKALACATESSLPLMICRSTPALSATFFAALLIC